MRNDAPMNIREIKLEEHHVLEDFLYNAIYVPEGEEWPTREIIFEPEIYVYIKDFGLDTDCGVVAECGGKIIGAAWTRIIPAYGHLDENTPELAISVLPGYRSQNVGTKLIGHARTRVHHEKMKIFILRSVKVHHFKPA